MIYKIFIPFCLVLALQIKGTSQTIGTLLNTPSSVHNLTLIAPNGATSTHLVNNCGFEVKRWDSEYRAGLAAYLDTDGNLYRAGRVNSEIFRAGGIGGVIEKFSWEGNLIWRIEIANSFFHLHHDFTILPNGNVVALAWEYFDQLEAVALGKKADEVSEDGFWPTAIIEIAPKEGVNEFDVVWEWHAVDHLVQDLSPGNPNFGSVGQEVGKFDLNYTSDPNTFSDWLHCNSIDFNAKLNHLLISSRNASEIFILDHSITSEKAKGDAGDILFRYGNPENYDQMDASRILYGQHDANWIDQEESASIVLFNNGGGRDEVYSDVLEIASFWNGEKYDLPIGSEKNERVVWSYGQSESDEFFEASQSGAIRIDNGNTLVTKSSKGEIIEIDTEGEVVWNYVVPINSMGPLTQGGNSFANAIFKARSYDPSSFNFKVELPEDAQKIELEPLDNCVDYFPIDVASQVQQIEKHQELQYRITDHGIEVFSFSVEGQVVVYDMQGKKVAVSALDEYVVSTIDLPFHNHIYVMSHIANGKVHSTKLYFP